MTVIVCLDNRYGMLFNNRRQSRDRNVISDIVSMTEGRRLFIEPYSAKLFEEFEIEPCVSENFLEEAGDEDFCFVENRHLMPYAEKIQKLIIYKWNRDYPSDFQLDIDPEPDGFGIVESSEFPGSSHDMITKEVFGK